MNRITNSCCSLSLPSLCCRSGCGFGWDTASVKPCDSESERTVDPARLEAHVRKLSVELTPRDESHIENLGRVAEYIKNEFSQTATLVNGRKTLRSDASRARRRVAA